MDNKDTVLRCPTCGDVDSVRYENIGGCADAWHRPAAAKTATKLWHCPDCGFGFDAAHTDKDGGYHCPACAEIALIEALTELRDACLLADANEDLAPEIDGSLLDKAKRALGLAKSPREWRLTEIENKTWNDAAVERYVATLARSRPV